MLINIQGLKRLAHLMSLLVTARLSLLEVNMTVVGP